MKYRKKPVVIEAVRFDGSSTQRSRLRVWMAGGEYVESGLRTSDMQTLTISTLEGDMRLKPGDWLIKGVAGEFYPCDHKIFEQTYEKVED